MSSLSPVDERLSYWQHPGTESGKLKDHHLSRSAIVYIRQSTGHQVLQNTESTARQYALMHRAIQLGWANDRVQVFDEDLGCSGTSAEGRLGFQRLLSEVSLNHVGIIFGIEMSRIARSNKDWHQLIELCGIFGTLLADQDGLYDPTDYNDRLLLGLRGMMSEAELHLMRGRMHEALLNKARRGALRMRPPLGYVLSTSGEYALDPDEQAQCVVMLVFNQFERLGSVRAVLRYLQANDIKLPIRPHKGPNKNQLEWRRAVLSSVSTILTHPLFSGTYRYGHKQTDPRRKKPGRRETGRVVVAPEKYHALIHDHCPAYISRDQYERNQRKIADNRLSCISKGPARDGVGLLGGILYCGRCGTKMIVHYSTKQCRHRYCCQTGANDTDIPRCQSLTGDVLDDLVAEKILKALEPASLELSMQAATDLADERKQVDRDWQQKIERSRYDAERMHRQYQTVEPENRLVARELERNWESALQKTQELEHDYARFCQSTPITLTAAERGLIQQLANDIPSIWQNAATANSDRQRIARLLIERVEVNVQGTSDHADISLCWSGGFQSYHECIRPVIGYENMADYERMVNRIEELRNQGQTFGEIANCLNVEGFKPAQRAAKFHKNIVSRLFRKLRNERPLANEIALRDALGENEWITLTLAKKLEMPKNTLLEWVRRGWIHIVRQQPGYRGRKICWADELEIKRLIRLRDFKRRACDPPLPHELTTPRKPGS